MRKLLIVLVTSFALMMSAACSGSSSDVPESSDGRVVTAAEQQSVKGLADIGGDDGYDSFVNALDSAGYRAVQIINDDTLQFVQCVDGQTLQECASSVPTTERPHVFTDWAGGEGVSLRVGTLQGYVARIGETTLSCIPAGAFQLNPYTVTLIPRVFQASSEGEVVRTGELEVDFGGAGEGYEQGLVRWTCNEQ